MSDKNIFGSKYFNREWGGNIKPNLFEEVTGQGPYEYWYRNAGEPWQEERGLPDRELIKVNRFELIKSEKPIFGLKDFFARGMRVVDLGCGGGRADIGIARDFPEIYLLGIDRAFGLWKNGLGYIPAPLFHPGNVRFRSGNWRNLDFIEAGTVDRIFSVEGVAKHDNSDEAAREVTRIAAIGAVMRATEERGFIGIERFSDRLCELGWDIYRVENSDRVFVGVKS